MSNILVHLGCMFLLDEKIWESMNILQTVRKYTICAPDIMIPKQCPMFFRPCFDRFSFAFFFARTNIVREYIPMFMQIFSKFNRSATLQIRREPLEIITNRSKTYSMRTYICFCVTQIHIIIEFETKIIQVETWSVVFFIDKLPVIVQTLSHLKNLIFVTGQCIPKGIYNIRNYLKILTLGVINGK